MGITNILDMNNRISDLKKSVTSVEDAIPKFERKTITGTTDSNGWLTTGLSPQDYAYISCLNSGSVIIMVLNAQSDNTIMFKFTYGDGTPISNYSMTVTCLFMKI